MSKTKVGAVGYGTIGMRLADGVARQGDMELVGVVDVGPTLAVRALHESGMAYDLYLVDLDQREACDEVGIPVSGGMENLLEQVDVVLDATPAGIGAKNKELYRKHGIRAVFQGGEKNDIADVFFHGYANYEKGLGAQFLKLTSCNTTGLIRTVDALDREVGIEKVAITIVRRVADPADTHRGLVNVLKVDKIPNHQAVDLMTIMPHVNATGFLVHTPITHGHVISVVATPKKSISPQALTDIFRAHPRIRVFRIADGFNSNASLFKYARDLGNKRADMYEVGFWEECVGMSGDDILYAINIPQEAVTIPETIDGIRAAQELQTDRLEAVGLTNKYLGIQAGR
ncbi:MAG: type II glyceraldehyde-3-phosphate dehydrogenase [Anaerolineales bacterium]|nr:type II glyceraldehyde-3-phosphate dehydrogenase [Anaerolineales bacterium]